ncbi:MAG: metalloregulator ArsR/SmtB family transcription factor [Armatimonadetes bacterium]|nr:metalloregulator ArsR/SmtB family transcription factor [Armatimonadota bacterium]
MIALMESIADPSRRAILAELLHGPQKVGDIVVATGLRQPNVSNHLSRMRASGVVKSSKVGREVFYSFRDPEVLAAAKDVLRPRRTVERVELTVQKAAEFADAATKGDAHLCDRTVTSLLRQGESLVTIYSELFVPTMGLVGDWWESRAIDEGQEHLASSIVEQGMARVMQFCDCSRKDGPKAVFGCSEGNTHTMGLRMIHDLMQSEGWQNFFLGANVPNGAFVAAVRTHRPDVVMVSCCHSDNIDRCCELVDDLVQVRGDSQPFLLGVGGLATNGRRRDLLAKGVDFTAESLSEFAEKTLPELAERVSAAPLVG